MDVIDDMPLSELLQTQDYLDLLNLVLSFLPLTNLYVLSCVSQKIHSVVWKNMQFLALPTPFLGPYSHDSNLTPEQILHYLERAPQIRKLSLGHLPITSASLVSVLLNCACPLTNLQALELHNARDEALQHLSGVVNLKQLSLSHSGLATIAFPYLFNSLESLELVSVVGSRELSSFTNLKELKLSSSAIENDGILALGDLTCLEHLMIKTSFEFDTKALSSLGTLTKLKTLALPGAGAMFDQLWDLKNLDNLTGLTTLNLYGSPTEESGYSRVRGLTNLRYLGIELFTQSTLEVLFDIFVNLEVLKISLDMLSEDGVKYFRHCTNLKKLCFATQQDDVSHSYENLPSSLTKLSLTSDTGTQLLTHLTNLTDLSLYNPSRWAKRHEYEESFSCLTNLTRLRVGGVWGSDWFHLLLPLTQLVSLDNQTFSGRGGTDRGSDLHLISNLTRLTQLDMSALEYNPNRLPLENLTRLEKMSIQGMKDEASPSILFEMQPGLKQVKVYGAHDGPWKREIDCWNEGRIICKPSEFNF